MCILRYTTYISYYAYAYDDDDDYYYYIIVDLYIALENIFTCLPDVSSFLHILLQRYTIPEQYTCTGSRFSGQFVYFHHHDKPISVSHDIYTTKIDGVVCPPNISETVEGRLMKLAHRPRIASTMIKLISKPILLPIFFY